MRLDGSTPFSNNASKVAPDKCFGGSCPAQTRKWMAGFAIIFFTIFSIPMFSVSTFPTIHNPWGADCATAWASGTLPNVVTATGALGSRTMYLPGM